MPRKKKIDNVVLDAAKEAGLSDEQIKPFDNQEKLLEKVQEVNPPVAAFAKQVLEPQPETMPSVQDEILLQSRYKTGILQFTVRRTVNEYQFARRCDVEDNELSSFLRKNGIQQHKIVRIGLSREYEPKKGFLETYVMIVYRN